MLLWQVFNTFLLSPIENHGILHNGYIKQILHPEIISQLHNFLRAQREQDLSVWAFLRFLLYNRLHCIPTIV